VINIAVGPLALISELAYCRFAAENSHPIHIPREI